MDIQTRKIQIIKEFLIYTEESFIKEIEDLLLEQRKRTFGKEIKPMSMEDYGSLLEKAVKDKNNGKVKNAKTLKKEIATWK